MTATGSAGRLPIVGVMGSGADPWEAWTVPLGRWLAEQGCHLLTGGGGGVMEAVSRAFHDTPGRRGLVLGVLPGGEGARAPESRYPNPWVEVAIRTHLPLSGDRGREPLSRNHINVLTSDVVVALPGGAGTESEVALALQYGRPLVVAVEGGAGPPAVQGAALARDAAEVVAFVSRVLSGWDGTASTAGGGRG